MRPEDRERLRQRDGKLGTLGEADPGISDGCEKGKPGMGNRRLNAMYCRTETQKGSVRDAKSGRKELPPYPSRASRKSDTKISIRAGSKLVRELLKDAFGAGSIGNAVCHLFGVSGVFPDPAGPGKFQFSLSLQPRPLRKPQNRKRRQKKKSRIPDCTNPSHLKSPVIQAPPYP